MWELFKTNIGSHMWKMNNAQSDEDLASVYVMNSANFLTRINLDKKIRGKQKHNVNHQDLTWYELSSTIEHLLKGNINFIWTVMSPIVLYERDTALRELREIVQANLSKKIYHSTKGITEHNIYHFIKKGDRESKRFQKKLNLIGRSLQFGITVLEKGICEFKKIHINNEDEIRALQQKLEIAYTNSKLPEETNSKPFMDYLLKWRLIKLHEDKLL